MRRPGRPLLALVSAVALAVGLIACAGSSDSASPATTAPHTTSTTRAFRCDPPASGHQTIEVDGTTRTFEVGAPASYDRRVPMVLLLHGFGGSATEFGKDTTGLLGTGPRHGVVVAVPQASGDPASWGIIDGFDADQTFIDDVIAQVTSSSCVDPKRVIVAGFSAGSAMTGVYGCSRADRVEALVMVSGLPPAVCPKDHTPRVLVVNGTADPVVAFEGGNQQVNGGVIPLASIPDSVASWAARAGCTGGPADTKVGADVAVRAWTSCAHGGPVDLTIVTGGGHAWPGAVIPAATGGTTQTVSVSCVVRAIALDAEVSVSKVASRCPGEGPKGG